MKLGGRVTLAVGAMIVEKKGQCLMLAIVTFSEAKTYEKYMKLIYIYLSLSFICYFRLPGIWFIMTRPGSKVQHANAAGAGVSPVYSI